ncbi:MAG: TRAP transporter large permease subunit, partial [Sphingomonadales bacterium]|nr:TRAP transporter large permease subunit [Sphingomonadales bacterium]
MIAALSTITLSLVVLLGLGMWVGLALMATGLISLSLFRDMPVLKLLAFDMWNGLNAPELVALPMFILMGEILFHSRLSDNLFTGLAPFMRRIPGKLLHTNIVGCTLFAAVSGSSAATAATVGRITLGELEKRGYDRDLAIGSLAGAGTLGFLIPPSLILILYGVLADVSILELFIAGLIPGLILAASYSIYVMIRASANPSAVPQDDDVAGRKRDALKLILPVVGLIAIIIA